MIRRLAEQSRLIGILNHLFFWPEQYRLTGGMSIVFLFDEYPDIASVGSGGAAVGGARSVPDHAARSTQSERAVSSRCNRFRSSDCLASSSSPTRTCACTTASPPPCPRARTSDYATT